MPSRPMHNARPMTRIASAAAALASAIALAPAGADLTYTGSAVVTEPTSQPHLVAVGDVFHFTFSYDPSVTDINPDDTNGEFPNAYTHFDAWADPANTGTWVPDGGNFIVPRVIRTGNDFFDPPFDLINATASASGLPTFTPGDVVDGVSLRLSTFDTGFLTDTSSGQTLDELLGGALTTDITVFDEQAELIFNEDDGSGFAAQIISLASAACGPADLNADGILDIDDVLIFLDGFAASDPVADIAPPSGVFDIDDVLTFLDSFAAGCP